MKRKRKEGVNEKKKREKGRCMKDTNCTCGRGHRRL